MNISVSAAVQSKASVLKVLLTEMSGRCYQETWTTLWPSNVCCYVVFFLLWAGFIHRYSEHTNKICESLCEEILPVFGLLVLFKETFLQSSLRTVFVFSSTAMTLRKVTQTAFFAFFFFCFCLCSNVWMLTVTSIRQVPARCKIQLASVVFVPPRPFSLETCVRCLYCPWACCHRVCALQFHV